MLGVMHIGIHQSHGIVGYAHAVLIVAYLGIVEHALHLTQCSVQLFTEDVVVQQVVPHLIIVVPHLTLSQLRHVLWHVFGYGVCLVVIVEVYRASPDGSRHDLVFVLGFSLVNQFVIAARTVVDVGRRHTQLLQFMQSLEACLTLQ